MPYRSYNIAGLLALLLVLTGGRASAQLYINDSLFISPGGIVYTGSNLVMSPNAEIALQGDLYATGNFQNQGSHFMHCGPYGSFRFTAPPFDTNKIDIGITTNNQVQIVHQSGWSVPFSIGLGSGVYRNPDNQAVTVDTGVVNNTWRIMPISSADMVSLAFSWEAQEELLFNRSNAVVAGWKSYTWTPEWSYFDHGAAKPLGNNRYRVNANIPYLQAGNWSFTVSDTTSRIITSLPSKDPVALPADWVSENGMLARWSSFSGAFAYKIEVATDSLFNNMFTIMQTWDTTWYFYPMDPNTTYFYRVQVITAFGTGNYSNIIRQSTHIPQSIAYFRTRKTGVFSDQDTWEYNYVDTLYKPATILPYSNNIAVNTGDTLKIDIPFTIASGLSLHMLAGSCMEILPGAEFAISGTADLSGQPVIFRSDATGSARLGYVFGSLLNAGNVTVERYIPAKAVRRFSLLTAPVTSTITTAWQQQIHITGPGTGGTPCANAAGSSTVNSNGFDATASNAASMFYYDEANPSKWLTIPNTSATNLSPGKGFRVNVRGDRSLGCALLVSNPPLPGPVVLRATGQPGSGNISVPLQTVSGTGYTLLGNPYPAPIRFSYLRFTNPYISPFYWTYSPENNSGIYSVYNANANYMLNAPAGYLNPNTIASGQAFFVESNGYASSILFQENMKDPLEQTGMFKTTTVTERVIAGLKTSTGAHLDEVLVDFNSDGTSTGLVPGWDVRSMNSGTRIASLKDGEKLAMQARTIAPSGSTDTVALFVEATAGSYKLAFSQHQQFNGNIYLLDRFSTAVQDIKTDTGYTFTVTADTNTKGSGRFALIFQQGSPLAVTNLATTAREEQNGTVKVNWNVNNEAGIKQYEVERATDGSNFSALTLKPATGKPGNASYTWTDANPETTNYYRIRATKNDGQAFYGNVVMIRQRGEEPSVTLYPNPVKDGTLFINFSHVATGTCALSVRNAMGQEVFNTALEVTGNEIKKIDLPAALSNGIYVVQLTGTSFNFKENIHINK